jgi:ATP-dependent DNA helicase RecQ
MSSIDSILKNAFGLEEFRPHQRAVIEDVMAGRNTLCVMPTGAGKSLCFQLPAVAMGGLAVIVSPLISLMADQLLHLRRQQLPTLVLNSAQPAEMQMAVLRELRQGYSGLLYVAPERFASASFQRILPRLRPTLFAVDEAHCVSLWGHDFRPEYKRLAEVRRQLGNPATIAVTATATKQVQKDILAMLGLDKPKVHVTGFDRTNLSYACRRFEKNADKTPALLRFLSTQEGSGIVYCATRKSVEELGSLIGEKLHGRTVCIYHAGLEASARKRNQLAFMQSPDAIAVATNAFGMGIDKPATRFVVHYNLPGSLEAYYQEAGRAGRDGQPASCLLYHSGADLRTQRFFIDRIGENNSGLTPAEITRLRQHASRNLNLMLEYAEESRCRRLQILEYFGDEQAQVSGCNCDVCQEAEFRRLHPNAVLPEQIAEARRKAGQVVDEEPKSPRKRSGKKIDHAARLNERQRRCFEHLRAWRLELAKSQAVPPFMILTDATMAELSLAAPRDEEELLAVPGIGPRKAELLGRELLRQIAIS